jgi:hypothetical protein
MNIYAAVQGFFSFVRRRCNLSVKSVKTGITSSFLIDCRFDGMSRKAGHQIGTPAINPFLSGKRLLWKTFHNLAKGLFT